jgi:hypothetical protein
LGGAKHWESCIVTRPQRRIKQNAPLALRIGRLTVRVVALNDAGMLLLRLRVCEYDALAYFKSVVCHGLTTFFSGIPDSLIGNARLL